MMSMILKVQDIKSKVGMIKNASDGWITYNREYYDDELFNNFSKEIQEME